MSHTHNFDIHYTAVDWQDPIFIKCLECGSSFKLIRHAALQAMERLADAAEDIGFTQHTEKDMEELRNAWQTYVDVAPRASHPLRTHSPGSA